MKNAGPTDDISRAGCNADCQSSQVGKLLRSAHLVEDGDLGFLGHLDDDDDDDLVDDDLVDDD